MGWLKRMFGMEKPEDAQVNPTPTSPPAGGGGGTATATPEAIAPERMGLNGEYDQSGLAKRVALAFDSTPDVADLDHVFVAQLGSVVVLKGTVPDQAKLDRLVQVARGVAGTTDVQVDQVSVSG